MSLRLGVQCGPKCWCRQFFVRVRRTCKTPYVSYQLLVFGLVRSTNWVLRGLWMKLSVHLNGNSIDLKCCFYSAVCRTSIWCDVLITTAPLCIICINFPSRVFFWEAESFYIIFCFHSDILFFKHTDIVSGNKEIIYWYCEDDLLAIHSFIVAKMINVSGFVPPFVKILR